MAQKVNIVMIDDIDQTEIPDGTSQTINFAIDGASYVIDLNSENADGLRSALAPYVAKARKVRSTRSGKTTTAASVRPNDIDRRRQVRAWARENGYDIGERGRIPTRVYRDFDAAKAG